MTGMWVTIDGPGGSGKTTIAHALANRFAAEARLVCRTHVPSRSAYGQYVRGALDALQDHPSALACVFAADRYQQVRTEIVPQLRRGAMVVSDRYVASGALDIARGVSADTVWQMHAGLPKPDLAVILTVAPDVAQARIHARGTHSRWQAEPGNAAREASAYLAAADHLRRAGWSVVTISNDDDGLVKSVGRVVEQVAALLQQAATR